MNALPATPDQNCCLPECDDVVVQNIAGPKGDDGADGADGEDGVSAFTLTAANFTMPAEGANVAISTTTSTEFMAIGVMAYAQGAGHMRVMSLGVNSVTLRNEENTATGAYSENVAPGTVIASGAKICLNGLQGIPGTGSGDLISTNNLNDVANVTTSRSNLGLAIGTNVQAFSANLTTYAGIPPSVNVQSVLGAANFAAIRALLTLVPGTDVQAFSAALALYAVISPSANIQSFLGAANYAAARTLLSLLPRAGLLGNLTAVDLSVLGDTLIPIVSSTRYRVTHIIIENASASLATVMLGVFSAAGGIGTIAANQAVTAATAADKFVSLTISSIGLTDIFTGANLYFRVGTAQAATVNVWVFGESFS